MNNLTEILDQDELESIKHLRDTIWTFVFPVFCFVGSLTNLVTIYVFVHVQFRRNNVHRLMLAYSVADFFYLTIGSFAFVFKCGSLCDLDKSFTAQVYGYIFIDYITSVLAIFNILIEVFLSMQRYLIIINKKYKMFNMPTNNTLLIILCVSLVYYLPIFFSKTIIQKEEIVHHFPKNQTYEETNRTVYMLEPNEFGKSFLGKGIIVTLAAIRNLVLLNLIIVFSLLTLYEFRKYIVKKARMKRSQQTPPEFKANRNITLTVVSVSFVFIIGHVPYAIAFVISIVNADYLPYSLICYRIFCFLMLFIAHSFNIVIFYFSNRLFRNILNNMFRSIWKCRK
jgi:hypothetical protein